MFAFRAECNLHDLPSLLITPVQRIPRYTMLLQDLQRHTPSGSRCAHQAFLLHHMATRGRVLTYFVRPYNAVPVCWRWP
jgi:hypothetical protein